MDKLKNIIRKLLKWLGWGFAGILVLAAVFLFILTTGPGETLVKNIAVSQIQKAIEQNVKIDELETNLYSRLQIWDIAISRQDTSKKQPYFQLKHAYLKYNLFSLLSGKISVPVVRIDGVRTDILVDKNGQMNIPFLQDTTQTDSVKKKEDKNNVLPFRMNKLILQHVSAVYNDQQTSMQAAVTNLNLEADRVQNLRYNYSLHIDSLQFTYEDTPVAGHEIRIVGQADPVQQSITDFFMKLPDMQLTAKGDLRQDSTRSRITGRVQLQGDTENLIKKARKWIPADIYPIQGNIQLTANISGSLQDPEVDLLFTTTDFTAADVTIQQGKLAVSWQPERVNIKEFHFQLLDGEAAGQGKIGLGKTITHDINVHIDQMNIAKVWQIATNSPSYLNGIVEGDVQSTGQGTQLADFNTTANLQLIHLNYNNKKLPNMRTRLTLKSGHTSFDLMQGKSEITADVSTRNNRYEGSFAGKIEQLTPLANLADIQDLNGSISFDGQMSGMQNQPEIHANFSSPGIQYRNFPVDTISGNITYQNRQTNISNVYFAGKIDTVDTLNAPFDLSEFKGKLAYHGQINGPVDNPNAYITIDLDSVHYQKYSLNWVNMQAELKQKQVVLSNFYAAKDSLLLSANAFYDIDSAKGRLEVALQSDQTKIERSILKDGIVPAAGFNQNGEITASFDLADSTNYALDVKGDQVAVHWFAGLVPDTLDIDGNFGFTASFTGNFIHPHADLKFRIQQPRFQKVVLDSIKGEISLVENTLALDTLMILTQQQSSSMQASIEMSREEDGSLFISNDSKVSGRAKAAEIDMQILNPFLSPPTTITGLLSYDLQWHGEAGFPRANGEIRVLNGTIQPGNNIGAIQELQVNVSVKDSTVMIDDVSGFFRDIPLGLFGRITLKDRQHINTEMNFALSDSGIAYVNGNISENTIEMKASIDKINLSLFQYFLKDFKNLNGTFNSNLTISGEIKSPKIEGKLSVNSLALAVPDYKTNVKNGVIRLNFNEKEVRIDTLYAAVNQGTLTVGGYLIQDDGNLQDIQITAVVKNVKFEKPDYFVATIQSANLEYEKQKESYLLQGDVILGESRVVYNIQPQLILSSIQSVDRPKREAPGILQKTRLDVRVTESQNIWVDNNLARIRIHPEVTVIGSPADINLSGRVSIEEGYLFYLDRKFSIDEGTIDFVDPNKINPIVNYKATTSITSYQTVESTEYTIHFQITGQLDEVTINLTSDPALSKPDIISLLTLGATRQQLTSNNGNQESSLRQLLLQRAEAISSQRISGFAAKKLGNLLGLEEVSIQGNLFNFDQSWGPQLVASKKISERVELTYTTSVGHLNEQGIRLEYKISRLWYIEGQTNQQGQSGIDFKYKLKFK